MHSGPSNYVQKFTPLPHLRGEQRYFILKIRLPLKRFHFDFSIISQLCDLSFTRLKLFVM